MGVSERGVTIRRLAIVAIAGQLIWFGFVVFGGLWESGYSELRDAVSYLGARNAADPWIFNTVIAISGLSVVALAAGLALDAPRGWKGRLGPVLIATTGLAQILDGFPFPADCRRTIDAGCRVRELAGDLSWQHYAHGWAFFLGALALLLSVFAMAWRFHGDPRWGRADRLVLGLGIVAVAIVVGIFFFADKEAGGHYGLVQRLALTAAMVWVVGLALALRDLYGRRRFFGSVRKTTSQSGEETP